MQHPRVPATESYSWHWDQNCFDLERHWHLHQWPFVTRAAEHCTTQPDIAVGRTGHLQRLNAVSLLAIDSRGYTALPGSR
jgi:hypothetical protein